MRYFLKPCKPKYVEVYFFLLVILVSLWKYLSEHFQALISQPSFADKPRITIDISEFKSPYGGFMKLMCRIDAVPLPSSYEMRVGGNEA